MPIDYLPKSILQMLQEAERQYKEHEHYFKSIGELHGVENSLRSAEAAWREHNNTLSSYGVPDWIRELRNNSMAYRDFDRAGYGPAGSVGTDIWSIESINSNIARMSNENQYFVNNHLKMLDDAKYLYAFEGMVEIEKMRVGFLDNLYGLDRGYLRDSFLNDFATHAADVNYIEQKSILSIDEVRAAGVSAITGMDRVPFLNDGSLVEEILGKFDWDKIEEKYRVNKADTDLLRDQLSSFSVNDSLEKRKKSISGLRQTFARIAKDKKNSLILFSGDLANPRLYFSGKNSSGLWLVLLLLVTTLVDKELIKNFLFFAAANMLLDDLKKGD